MEGSVAVLICLFRLYFGVISSLFGLIWTDLDMWTQWSDARNEAYEIRAFFCNSEGLKVGAGGDGLEQKLAPDSKIWLHIK